ncbi:hypothetical protein VTN31DRAFT_6610 [Thermomyces dupontii]|uniref:uncharacterized protein n=1 Tax=Talaromyces thermophilus TaxID=28565 RepID=UPI003742D8BF
MAPSVGRAAPESASPGTAGVFVSMDLRTHHDAKDRYDIMEARSQRKSRVRYCDIVGSLPPEILLQIVERLDPADIVQSQKVSKRWRYIFSSDAITSLVLRRTLAFLNTKEKENALLSAPDVNTYFRWRHGLEYGKPVRKIFLPWPQSSLKPAKVF